MQKNYIPWKIIEAEVQNQQQLFNSPELAYAKAETFKADGKWQEAACMLHNTIQNKRSR